MNSRTAIDWTRVRELSPASDEIHDAAAAELALLHRRRMIPPAASLSDIEWAVLLELFVADGRGSILQTKSLTLAAGVAPTTVLRYLELLEGKGLIHRAPCPTDGRSTLVAISRAGRRAVATVFSTEGTPNDPATFVGNI
ncbi:MarR family winged helix-turn-helix transcriptional regulator [Tsuneonella sp. HG094]